MQLQERVSHKITIRFRSGITAKMRIKFGTRMFNIRSVINIEERSRWIEIMADEGVPT
jgi:SPP1 family predicted phage head-tail adaptor